jgi:hypothetical protein
MTLRIYSKASPMVTREANRPELPAAATILVPEHARTVSKCAGWWVAAVRADIDELYDARWCCGTSLRCDCDGIPHAGSGTPCVQQVFRVHNDVGAGTGRKPAGADRE